jgi:16S rRNA (uracil1498-N3)-methyltransferase
MIEAAEQCGRTALPELAPPVALPALLAGWSADRMLVFADEAGGAPATGLGLRWPAALLIGPEGGFSEAERQALLAVPKLRRLSLGPRVLRADTAAVAGLAQLLLVLG